MPIIRTPQALALFVHIPKCGGSSVELALQQAGVPLAFLDQRFGLHATDPWYRSSPQHISRADRDTLFPGGFFDAEFAIVRDPVARFLSAFNHHRRAIGPLTPFSRFLSRMERRVRQNGDHFGYRYDNHFLPAHRFIGERTQLLRLEDGLPAAMERIARIVGVDLPYSPQDNVRSYAYSRTGSAPRQVLKRIFAKDSPRTEELTPQLRARIAALYAQDYRLYEERLAEPYQAG